MLPEHSNSVGNSLLNEAVMVWVDISMLFPGAVLCHYHVVNTQKQPQSNNSLKENFYVIPSSNFHLGMLKELRIEVPLRNTSSVSKCVVLRVILGNSHHLLPFQYLF